MTTFSTFETIYENGWAFDALLVQILANLAKATLALPKSEDPPVDPRPSDWKKLAKLALKDTAKGANGGDGEDAGDDEDDGIETDEEANREQAGRKKTKSQLEKLKASRNTITLVS